MPALSIRPKKHKPKYILKYLYKSQFLSPDGIVGVNISIPNTKKKQNF